MGKTVSFWFTWPPSVNHIWRHGKNHKKTYKTEVAKKWQSDNDLSDHATSSESFGKARICVALTMFPPDKRKRDIDNFTKCVIDQMQAFKVFDDDSQIDSLLIIRKQVVKGGKILAVVEEA